MTASPDTPTLPPAPWVIRVGIPAVGFTGAILLGANGNQTPVLIYVAVGLVSASLWSRDRRVLRMFGILAGGFAVLCGGSLSIYLSTALQMRSPVDGITWTTFVVSTLVSWGGATYCAQLLHDLDDLAAERAAQVAADRHQEITWRLAELKQHAPSPTARTVVVAAVVGALATLLVRARRP